MLPEEYLEAKKSKQNTHRNLRVIWLLGLFTGSTLLLGPYLHEISHILWLDLHNCFYNSELVLSTFTGITGRVQSLCHMEKTNLLIFYAAGYLTTLTAGVTLNIAGTWMHHNSKKYAASVLSVGTGMLVSAIVTITVKGDVMNAVKTVNSPLIYAHAVNAIIVLGVFAAAIESFEFIIEEVESSERQE